MDIFITILRIHLLILTSIVERIYLHRNTWKTCCWKSKKGRKDGAWSCALIYMGSAFKSTHMSAGPMFEQKLQVQVHKALCTYDFDKLLFELFLHIHSTVTVSMGSGIQPWEKHEVCPLHFVTSTRWGTCLEVAAFTALQWNAPVYLAQDTADPLSIPICVRPHQEHLLFHLL